MSFLRSTLIATAIATIGTGTAVAATATANFDVLLKVTSKCNVTAGAASNLNFSSHDWTETNLATNNTISVACSKKTTYTVGLLPGNSNTAGAGVMSAQNTAPVIGNTDTVGYQLRQATGAAGAIWGNVSGNWVSGTGTGAAVTHTVYGTVPTLNVTPDDYKDTVLVTVTY